MLWLDRHRRFRDNLSAYIDADLSQRDLRALESHLVGCDACRREVDELRIAISAMRDLPQTEVPRSFALTQAMAGTRAGLPPWSGSPVFARYAAASLTVALAAVLVVDFADTGDGNRDDSQPLAGRAEVTTQDFQNSDAGGDAAGVESTAGAFAPAASPDPGANQNYNLTAENATDRAAGCEPPVEAAPDEPAATAPADDAAQDTDACAAVGAQSSPSPADEDAKAYESIAELEEGIRDELETRNALSDESSDGISTLRLIEIALALALAVAVAGVATTSVTAKRRS